MSFGDFCRMAVRLMPAGCVGIRGRRAVSGEPWRACPACRRRKAAGWRLYGGRPHRDLSSLLPACYGGWTWTFSGESHRKWSLIGMIPLALGLLDTDVGRITAQTGLVGAAGTRREQGPALFVKFIETTVETGDWLCALWPIFWLLDSCRSNTGPLY